MNSVAQHENQAILDSVLSTDATAVGKLARPHHHQHFAVAKQIQHEVPN